MIELLIIQYLRLIQQYNPLTLPFSYPRNRLGTSLKSFILNCFDFGAGAIFDCATAAMHSMALVVFDTGFGFLDIAFNAGNLFSFAFAHSC